MFAKSLLLALAAAGAATAQVQNYTSSLDMKLDPNQATAQERAQWCSAETNSCSQLCGNTETKNDCSASTLDYACICGSNSSAPALQYYTQTMPTFICQKLFDICNSQNVGNRNNQIACETNIRSHCGTQDPTKATTGGSSSASGSSTTASPQATGQTGGSGSASSTSSSHGLAAPTMAAGQGIAAAAAAVGVFAYLI
ncbi:PCI domain-containing protein [Cordyceps javanica]|uniref:PCI domain-containing protein n=1 Tax=Cordyceps javanica TaxID=43265 RepID=A0A545V1Z1_9HYPO|nr:PCI domain-containing protein [Cordyceps javanica]TQW07060.1 PCI domain-containing protein [Cordyceps javanica]